MGARPVDSPIERLFSTDVAKDPSIEARSPEGEVTALFDEFRLPLLRYLSSFGLSAADAEEINQEVFLSLFQHLRAGKPRTNLRGWIFRVGHNLGLKRRQANHRSLEIVANAQQHLAQRRDEGSNDPEAEVSFRQHRQRLLAIVGALPELDRRCLYLRAEGLRYREISSVLGISLGGVALSLARSLAWLAKF